MHIFLCCKLLSNLLCQLTWTEDSLWCYAQILISVTSAVTNCSITDSHQKSAERSEPCLSQLTYSSFVLTCPHARQWCRLLVSALKGSLHFMHMVTSLSRIHLGALFPSSAFWRGQGKDRRIKKKQTNSCTEILIEKIIILFLWNGNGKTQF